MHVPPIISRGRSIRVIRLPAQREIKTFAPLLRAVDFRPRFVLRACE